MKEKVIIIGAGGHGRVIADIVRACGDTVVGFLDDENKDGVIGKISDAAKYPDCAFFVAIGNNEIRKRLMGENRKYYTAVHPRACVSPDAVIGEGSAVMAGAVINCGAKIGRGVIINTLAGVDHDCTVGNFAHISPGAHIAGTTNIGNAVWVGCGACVVNNITVCDGCVIGAGAAVTNDITAPGTYGGVPAKLIK